MLAEIYRDKWTKYRDLAAAAERINFFERDGEGPTIDVTETRRQYLSNTRDLYKSLLDQLGSAN